MNRPKGNQKHLTLSQRIEIEKGLHSNHSFTEIARSIVKKMFYKIDNDENITRQYMVTGHSLQLSNNCNGDNNMYGIIVYLNEA